MRGDDGWSCSCPASGTRRRRRSGRNRDRAGFHPPIRHGARPGIVRAIATGCTRRGAPCNATSDAGHEAAARLEVALGLVAALRAAPVAALTVGGNLDAGASALGVHNRDAATGGLAIHAGGSVAGNALRLERRRRLAARRLGGRRRRRSSPRSPPTGFFAPLVRHGPGRMERAAGGDTDIDCAGKLRRRDRRRRHGGRPPDRRGRRRRARRAARARLAGAADRPASSPARCACAARWRCTASSSPARSTWRDAAANSGALVRGAASIEGNYQGDAAADFVHDATAARPAAARDRQLRPRQRQLEGLLIMAHVFPRRRSAAPPCSSRWSRSSSSRSASLTAAQLQGELRLHGDLARSARRRSASAPASSNRCAPGHSLEAASGATRLRRASSTRKRRSTPKPTLRPTPTTGSSAASTMRPSPARRARRSPSNGPTAAAPRSGSSSTA